MIPRIKLTKVRSMFTGVLHSQWRCALGNSIVCGYGKTPSDAYKHWEQKWRNIKYDRR